MRRADLITGVVTAALGAYALKQALDLAMFGTHRVPGPGFFPTAISALLLFLGVLLAVTSLRPHPTGAVAAIGPQAAAPSGTAAPAGTGALAGSEERAGWQPVARAGSVWLCFSVTTVLVGVLGFVPATAILVFVLLCGIEGRRDWRALLAAIAIPVATFALFVNVLSIQLPLGLIGNGPLGI